MTSRYLEEVTEDVKNYIENEINLDDYRDEDGDINRDELEEYLNDTLWIEDSVTGNASGSYTFNRARAKEKVFADLDSVKEAFEEFGEKERFADLFFNEEWETIDVITRCALLGQAIGEALDDMNI